MKQTTQACSVILQMWFAHPLFLRRNFPRQMWLCECIMVTESFRVANVNHQSYESLIPVRRKDAGFPHKEMMSGLGMQAVVG